MDVNPYQSPQAPPDRQRVDETEPDPPKAGSMTLLEAYIVFTILLSMFILLIPSVQAAREIGGATEAPSAIHDLIVAMLPQTPVLPLVVAPIYAAAIAVPLTALTAAIRRVLPGRSVWLATILVLAPILALLFTSV
jgi:hypothetical protein